MADSCGGHAQRSSHSARCPTPGTLAGVWDCGGAQIARLVAHNPRQVVEFVVALSRADQEEIDVNKVAAYLNLAACYMAMQVCTVYECVCFSRSTLMCFNLARCYMAMPACGCWACPLGVW